jgi:exodeoxyribonuclease-5
MGEINLSASQQNAVNMIKEWFQEQEAILVSSTRHDEDFNVIGQPEASMTKPIFRVFGYAGTGKTTIIRHFMETLGIRSETCFAAFTGKAAMVMRKQGVQASTIHSLIYEPVPPSEKECKEIEKKILEAETVEEKGRLKGELAEKSKVHFVLRDKDNSRLKNARLLVLDEVSMINDQMLQDLMTFNIPMIVLGDKGQLPPIDGEGALTRVPPDVLLTEIHRQAEGNPIIDFATRARNGIYIPKIQLGRSKHCDQASLGKEEVLAADQIICGKNTTRRMLNQRIRSLRGYSNLYPQVGEKLQCLKNNAEKQLFNGLMCEVVAVRELLDVSIQLDLKLETDLEGKAPTPVLALRAHFDVYKDPESLKNIPWYLKDGIDEFDFGYAITCHKAQGSQWDKVLIWDDKFLIWKKQERKQWLYTAITRAVDSVTIAS